MNEADVYAKLTSGKSFVWIRRRLTPTQQYQVNRLGIPGLQFINEERRVYPYGDLASHVVGFCGIDNNGLAGIERALDETVKSSAGPLQLSLDARVQFIVHEELAKVISDFSAKGGAGLVMDVNTGEIIAMVSLPDFDPNHPGVVDPKLPQADAKDRIFNRNTLGVYEMGSVFKIFNTAMALDAGVTSMTKGYDASHSIQDRAVHDRRLSRQAPLARARRKSSCIRRTSDRPGWRSMPGRRGSANSSGVSVC